MPIHYHRNPSGKGGKIREKPRIRLSAKGAVGGSALKRFLREQKLRVANK